MSAKKYRNTPAKCANCGDGHTASYRGCACWPKLQKQEDHRKPARPVTESVSYASAASPSKNQKPEFTFSDLYSQMKAMFAQMENMAKKLGMKQPDKTTNNNQ